MTLSEKLFIAIGAVGFLVLLGSFLLGEVIQLDHDLSGEVGAGADHDLSTDNLGEPSWFSLKVITASMVGFGASGYIASANGIPDALAWPVALAGALAIGAGTFYLVLKPLAKQQSNSLLSRESYRGLAGEVTLAITDTQPGLVRFRDRNSALVTQRAVLADGGPLPAGAKVLIVDINETGVIVMPDTTGIEVS